MRYSSNKTIPHFLLVLTIKQGIMIGIIYTLMLFYVVSVLIEPVKRTKYTIKYIIMYEIALWFVGIQLYIKNSEIMKIFIYAIIALYMFMVFLKGLGELEDILDSEENSTNTMKTVSLLAISLFNMLVCGGLFYLTYWYYDTFSL